MKRFFYPLTLAFITLISSTLSASNPADWETYFENDSIKIEFAYQNCENDDTELSYVCFKISNKTKQLISVTWKQVLWYNDECFTCNYNDNLYIRTLNLEALSSLESDCTNNTYFNVFAEYNGEWNGDIKTKPSVLTNFELTNITIKL